MKNIIPNEIKSLCLFAMCRHTSKDFSENNIIYINVLSKYFDFVIIIADIENGDPDTTNIPINCSINLIPNIGLDFGKFWSILLEIKDNYSFEKLALINDSCFLIKDLKDIFDWGNKKDFWGITLSEEYSPHLQSYFLVFESKKSIDLLLKFVHNNNVFNNIDRDQIIRKYEIGLSTFMIQNGIELHALYNVHSVKEIILPHFRRRNRRLPSNVAFFLWDRMIHKNCPIIKVKRYSIVNEQDFINKYKDDSLWSNFVDDNIKNKIISKKIPIYRIFPKKIIYKNNIQQMISYI